MTLIRAEALIRRAGDPRLRIADVRWTLGQPARGREAYQAGHVPGAVFVDLDRDLSTHLPDRGRHPLPDPAAFAERLGALGFGSDDAIVVYDDAGGTVAARLWWMLDALGHRDVALLDGGLRAWQEAGGTLVGGTERLPPARLELAAEWPRVISREALAERLDDVSLLDLRAGERYRGETEPVDPVAGHIPTARSAPATGNLGPDGRFLAPDALAARYRELGADERPVVVSCGSGVTATHGALAMRVAGLPDPILYGGSYSDWSSARLPVATGPEPGEPPGKD